MVALVYPLNNYFTCSPICVRTSLSKKWGPGRLGGECGSWKPGICLRFIGAEEVKIQEEAT